MSPEFTVKFLELDAALAGIISGPEDGLDTAVEHFMDINDELFEMFCGCTDVPALREIEERMGKVDARLNEALSQLRPN